MLLSYDHKRVQFQVKHLIHTILQHKAHSLSAMLCSMRQMPYPACTSFEREIHAFQRTMSECHGRNVLRSLAHGFAHSDLLNSLSSPARLSMAKHAFA